MIQLSQAAIKELKRLQTKQLSLQSVVRLSLQPGTCAAWSYAIQFENKPQADDTFFEQGDVRIVVAHDALSKLTGLTIDYAEDLMGGSFRFVNPNASQTCGCGIAFSTEADHQA
ncbi:MAG: iron-sulfur cluster assembly accessory protein [Cyanobacteria bacterium Co-bin8]|nr:iron-sulfur cluster assembly accessory protein [Cyanobacteria bacterium Co-bin8]